MSESFVNATDALRPLGEEWLRKGKVACVVLAGGVGSRFGSEKPKGSFPISAVKHKSLFELLVDRVRAMKVWGAQPQIAIMASEATHEETVSFFAAHKYFGLTKEDIDFFQQGALALLDDEGRTVLTPQGAPLTAPSGNGKMAWDLLKSGILEKWQHRGIECVTSVVIDNPLADPFDTRLIGFHAQQGSDITVVGVLREDPEESLGVFVEKEGRISVVEYSEMQESDKQKRLPDGTLKHPVGNISFFAFALPFLKEIAATACQLPLHRVKKEITKTQQEMLGIAHPISLWKSEFFIFDMLPSSKKTAILVMPRSECFAPLKNRKGQDSPQTVREALIKRDKNIFRIVTETLVPEEVIIELAPEFLYPTDAFKQKWRGKTLPHAGYIES